MTGEPTGPLVAEALMHAGFLILGQRRGAYIRLGWPDQAGDRHYEASLIVPLDPDAPEYPEMLAAVVAVLNRARDRGTHAAEALRIIEQPR